MALMRPMESMRSDLSRIFDEMDRLMEPFLGSRHPEVREHIQGYWFPAVDVMENGDEIVVKASIPGFKPEDVNIEVDDRTLLIAGTGGEERQEEKADGDVRYLRREIVSGQFFRKVSLPVEVLADKAKADFKNGVVTVRLPKTPQSKRHKIRIH